LPDFLFFEQAVDTGQQAKLISHVIYYTLLSNVSLESNMFPNFYCVTRKNLPSGLHSEIRNEPSL